MTQRKEFSVFQDLQGYLDSITDGMSRVRRWGRYGTFETVTEHTVQQAHLCLIMHALERAHGNADGIDRARLLACAILHDQGEGLLGDVLWYAKQHPKLKQPLEEVEREFYRDAVITPLPERIAADMERDYLLQDSMEDRTGRFFRASEVVGYVIRAVQQYRSGERVLGQETLVRQYVSVCQWWEEFTSVRIIYGGFREEVEYALAHDPECISFAEKEGRMERIRELLECNARERQGG